MTEFLSKVSQPFVSVIMSVYHEQEAWLKGAIDSILNQTFSDFEFIIVNDAPGRDINHKILDEYAKRDNRIVLIVNRENIGLTRSLNEALKIARGKYIARMDADDISLPFRIEKQCRIMEENERVIVCGTDVRYFGERNWMRHDWIKQENRFIKAQMLWGSCFVHPSVMMRRSVLEENAIRYDAEYKQAQDYRLWEVLADFGDFYNIKEVLLHYRVSCQQVSSSYGKEQHQYTRAIRRRIIIKWLNACGLNVEIPKTIDYKAVKEIRKAIIHKEAGIECGLRIEC